MVQYLNNGVNIIYFFAHLELILTLIHKIILATYFSGFEYELI